MEEKFIAVRTFNPTHYLNSPIVELGYLDQTGLVQAAKPDSAALFFSAEEALAAIIGYVLKNPERSTGWSIRKRVFKTKYLDIHFT